LIVEVQTVAFFIFASATLVSALMVITMRNPIYSALFLVITIFNIAGTFLLLSAELLAAIQVIIYAGAIMVLFLFVTMLLNVKEATRARQVQSQTLPAITLAIVLAAEFVLIISSGVLLGQKGEFTPEKIAAAGNVQTIGKALFNDYLLPFEVASLILLVGLIGSVALVLRRKED